MVTQDELKELLTYEPETGFFRWKKSRSNRAKVGGIAGWNDGQGYLRIRLDKKDYKVHRLAYFYMTGEWPKNQIDHADGNGYNNAWKNLREATNKQNQENLPLSKSNKSGFLGVYFFKSMKKWAAQVTHNRKKIYLGSFDTPEKAAAAATAKRAELYTHYTGRDKNMNTCQTVSAT